MEAAGCEVVKFHPHTLDNVGVWNERDHRKLVVVDGREAFLGGHCIVDEWLGDAEDGKHFADVSVRVRGPIVHTLQGVFSENWTGETGEIFMGDGVFPAPEPAGDVLVHAAFVKPEGSAPTVKLLHHAIICLATEKLLEKGVRLFEYPHTLLHQKVMTVDGVWCAIGSTNFDDRSFEINDEITLGFADATLAKRIDAIFEKYAARATEVELEAWRMRGLRHRIVDRLAYAINEVL
jgi:cardiolipin synthase